jgi:predicted Zn-dependent protease
LRTDPRLAVSIAVVLATAAAHAQSRKALQELGRLVPPAYTDPLVRQGEASAAFDEAIHAYEAKRYPLAADRFRRLIAVDPDDLAGNFYLAVTLMMTDEVGEAEDRLGAVLAAGESPFESAGRFVLAKACIRLGKLDEAEQQLVRVAASPDAWAPPAVELLPKVRALRKQK